MARWLHQWPRAKTPAPASELQAAPTSWLEERTMHRSPFIFLAVLSAFAAAGAGCIRLPGDWDARSCVQKEASCRSKDPRCVGRAARDMRGADLYGANLAGADLACADLAGADLYGANLHGANLRGADLRGADLYGANLGHADLSGADLRCADLYGANLQDANLDGARLEGAEMYGANL